MNYQDHYNRLIKKAQERKNIEGYCEKHHIIPKSLGGSNAKINIVELLAREHFLAHILLAKIHGKGLWQAAQMMKNKSGVQSGRIINSKLYAMAKREWSNYLKGKKRPPHVGEAIRKAKTGKKLSDETRVKMSEVRKGKPRSGDPTKWKHSDEAKAKMKAKHKELGSGSWLPKMYGDANPMKNPEVAKKISESKKIYWAKIRELKQKENL